MTIFTSDRRELLRKMQLPVLIAACFAPIPMLIGCLLLGEGWAVSLITPAVYILLAWLLLITPGKLRIPAGAAACVLLMLASLSSVPVMEDAWFALPALLFTAMMVYTIPMAGWKSNHEIHLAISCLGIVVHLVMQLLLNADSSLDDASRYLPVRTPMFLCFMVMILLQLLSMNRDNMTRAVNGGSTASPRLRRRNLAITMAVFALTMLLASLPDIIAAANRLWDTVWKFVGDAVLWLFNLFGQNNSSAPREGGGSGGMGLVGSWEVSPLAAFLQEVAVHLAYVGLVLVVLWALRVILRKLVQLARFLFDRFKKYVHVASEDYTDEITDVRDDDGERETVFASLRRRMTRIRVDESALTPRDRIRHVYRRLSGKHPEWAKSATARENIPASAASLYEKARYSAHDVSEQEAEQFRKGAKGV